DPKLRLVSRKIERIDDSLRRLIDDMIETMHEAPGVGLAAIQVAEPIRLLVVDVAKKDEPADPQVFVNPEIVWLSEERATYEEGCLSIRNITPRSNGPLRCAPAPSTATGSFAKSWPRACSRPCCSTRSTTWTASCSSTTFRSSSGIG